LNKANIHFSGPITPFPESVMALMPVDSHPLLLLHVFFIFFFHLMMLIGKRFNENEDGELEKEMWKRGTKS
jgi:hypothetical protein